MRSVFWRIFASFWLAIITVAVLSTLMGRLINQDTWILKKHSGIRQLAENWTAIYENKGADVAKSFLIDHQKQYRVAVQVLADSGDGSGSMLINDTFFQRQRRMSDEMPHHNSRNNSNNNVTAQSPWRQITEEYTSPKTGDNYLFIYRLPRLELSAWHRQNLWLPIGALIVTVIVLAIFSLLLTFSITRPLNRLRGAVQALGRTSYQKNSLSNLANRKDEFGVLAKEFGLMGDHLQALINSQRQLLRDVSHELRSPLARLKITLALFERTKDEAEAAKLLARASLESDRLEALIAEILTFARLDNTQGNKVVALLFPIVKKLQEDAKVNAPHQKIELSVSEDMAIYGWPDNIERALDNLIRNALRFNPEDKPIEITAWQQDDNSHITIRDHGEGVSNEHLAQLSEPFYRVPGQATAGYGLGLAIAHRVLETHNGQLLLSNHPEGGFVAELILPRS